MIGGAKAQSDASPSLTAAGITLQVMRKVLKIAGQVGAAAVYAGVGAPARRTLIGIDLYPGVPESLS